MGRRHLFRRVSSVPPVNYFKPANIPTASLDEVNLLVEEAEAIRLKDLEGLEQEDCAAKMNVSRTTFSRILDSGRQKVADALLNGKAIRIQGGNFEMAESRFRCIRGHEWNVPFEEMVDAPPEYCPRCETPSIMPLMPQGVNWNLRGRGGGRGRHGNRRY